MERKSIRKYKSEPLKEFEIQQILTAAFKAPSCKDLRPWEYIIVENKETLETMSNVAHYSKMLSQAAMGIVVMANLTCNENLDQCIQDCAAATENMLLEAATLDIGSCWVGCHPRMDRVEKLKSLFSLPNHIYPLWMISFGYPDEDPKEKNKWDVSKIHRERY
ncbi:MAG: nitroreductase family protein [Erysipelotrichaceae bacterium]|nr:nitroreductase family protein [Erysipelotrichaceae bacterium]